MARLPKVGGDKGSWGDILNSFLNVSHNSDGTLKDTGVLANKYTLPDNGIPEADLSGGVQAKLNAAANKDITDIANLSPANNDLLQRKSGAWTNRTPTQVKSDLGLNNVDNTSDADKPVSSATQTALNAKVDDSQIDTDATLAANSDAKVPSQKAAKAYIENVGSNITDTLTPQIESKEDTANKSTNASLGTSNTLFPTQNAVKKYVDSRVGQINVPFLSVDAVTTPITHSDLAATGMDYYPDGSIGFADSGGGGRVGVASNGSNVATVVHDSATGGILTVVNDDSAIQDTIDSDLDYYSGGPVFTPNAYGLSNDVGSVLMLHAEKHDMPNFWTGVGMAKFDANDQQWHDLGLVVTPEYAFNGTLTNSLDVGSGSFAFDDEWYYVFFKDSSDGADVTHLSIARAPLNDVIEAATNNGAAPVFTKYSGGSWSSTGVGGAKADDLLSDLGGYLIWCDVIRVNDYGGWALAYTRNLQSADTPVDTVEVIWSKDLIHWSAPQTIVAPDPDNERFYITLTSPLENEPYTAKVVKSGDPIDLYVVKSDIANTPAERWDTASVERYRLSVNRNASILAGAVQKTDTSTGDMDFVIDEDDMASNSDTKVPTQQSVKAYVDTATTGAGDVEGPNNATADAVAIYDGTTGKLLKDSTKTLPTSAIVGVSDTQVLTNKTFTDSTFFLQDDTDNTKKAQFQLSSIGGTRTYTLQNASGTIYISGGNDVSVADGGTGRSTSTTAYGLIAAGTTATGAQQTISPGTSGHILKSNGASALPSFSAGTASDVGLGNVTNDAQLKASDLIDEDNMASNSATKVPSQQSVKAYVDAIDTEHQVGGGGQPAFQNSWGASMGGAEFAIFYKDRHRVYFDALMTGGATGTVAFTLPAGYRPSSMKTIPTASSDGSSSKFAAITINTDGTVVPGFDPSFPIVSANISFRV